MPHRPSLGFVRTIKAHQIKAKAKQLSCKKDKNKALTLRLLIDTQSVYNLIFE